MAGVSLSKQSGDGLLVPLEAVEETADAFSEPGSPSLNSVASRLSMSPRLHSIDLLDEDERGGDDELLMMNGEEKRKEKVRYVRVR